MKALLCFVTAFSYWVYADPGADLLQQETQLTESQALIYQHIADQLRCPTCTGISVRQSESLFSQQIRSAVIEQIKEQKSEPEIMQFFIDRYGQWILREPPKEGLHWLAWLVPFCFFALGGLWVGRFLFQQKGSK
jgi:cytochrome c-type biogenesis protein CcmH/NrfF